MQRDAFLDREKHRPVIISRDNPIARHYDLTHADPPPTAVFSLWHTRHLRDDRGNGDYAGEY